MSVLVINESDRKADDHQRSISAALISTKVIKFAAVNRFYILSEYADHHVCKSSANTSTTVTTTGYPARTQSRDARRRSSAAGSSHLPDDTGWLTDDDDMSSTYRQDGSSLIVTRRGWCSWYMWYTAAEDFHTQVTCLPRPSMYWQSTV